MNRVIFEKLHSNWQGLPRLPIPNVTDTLRRYRDSVAGLKKKETVERHLEVVTNFEGSAADDLQSRLLKLDARDSARGEYPFSYIERIWDEGYLGFRSPSVVNVSPAFSLQPLSGVKSQVDAAARIIFLLTQWTSRISSEGLKVSGGTDTSQFPFQFATSRVPLEGKDGIFQQPLASAKHVTVLCGGHAYFLRVKTDAGENLSQSVIQSGIAHILNVSADDTPTLGVLSSGSRDDWAASFIELTRDPENAALIQKVQGSLAMVCLDSSDWSTPTMVQEAMLFGGRTDCENRWYDKHQIIVSSKGRIAFNFEHAFSDGLTWSSWIGDLWAMHESSESFRAVSASCDDLVQPLKIALGKSFTARIRSAKQDLHKLVDNVQVGSPVVPIGKEKLKGLNFSPDAFAQICFHHAYFKTHGKMAPTYEACSTSKFFHGRTETIRTATTEMHSLLETLESQSNVSRQQLVDVATKHVCLAKEAAAGLGVDRHLLALQTLAKHENVNHPFFSEDVFNYSKTWLMSTSNVSRPFLEFFNFGPVTADGYGIGYVIDEKEIRASVTAWKSSSLTDAAEMTTAVESSAQRIIKILEK